MQVRQCRAHSNDHHGELRIRHAEAHEASEYRNHREGDDREVRRAQKVKCRDASPLAGNPTLLVGLGQGG